MAILLFVVGMWIGAIIGYGTACFMYAAADADRKEQERIDFVMRGRK